MRTSGTPQLDELKQVIAEIVGEKFEELKSTESKQPSKNPLSEGEQSMIEAHNRDKEGQTRWDGKTKTFPMFRQKDIGSLGGATGPVGSPVSSLEPWSKRVRGNPFIPYLTVEQIEGGSFKLNQLSGVSVAERSTLDTALDASSSLTAAQIGIRNFSGRVRAGKSQIEDISNASLAISNELMNQFYQRTGSEIIAKISSSVESSGGFAKITTGNDHSTNNGVPAADSMIAKLAALITTLESQYLESDEDEDIRPVLICSMDFYGGLIESVSSTSGGQFSFDKMSPITSFDKLKVIPTSHLERVTADGETVAVLGDLHSAICFASRIEMSVDRQDSHTDPDETNFLGRTRYAVATKDPGALVGLVSGS